MNAFATATGLHGMGVALVLIDLAIAVTLAETVLLLVLHRRTGRGMPPRDLLPNLGAGLALMVALRVGLADAPWPWVAAALLMAGVAHAADLRRRWG